MHVHQLKDFTFRNHIGGLSENLHHTHAVSFDHHLKGARIQEVTHQNAGWVAKSLVCRRSPPP